MNGLIELGFESFNGHEINNIGSGEYGWEQDTYYGFESKLDYMFLQIEQTGTEENEIEYLRSGQAFLNWLTKEFESRGKTITLKPVVINHDAKYSWDKGYGYIDHQSVGTDEVREVLSSQKALLNFLFNDSCSFETDNDNH